uniref:Uncharacterized protein n=1 Tax=viral metagenome TaxID=1070528 RepID=A0A2V0R938_9ZZZZ
MDGNTLLSFDEFKVLDVRDQYLNYVREYNNKVEAKASLAAVIDCSSTRQHKVRRGIALPKGYGDLERLDQGMMVVMLRQVEKAVANNSPNLRSLVNNLKVECCLKRLSFDDLRTYKSDDLIASMLRPLSRLELCTFFALMTDLLSEVTPITRKTLKTMPLVNNEIVTPLTNITVSHNEGGRVIETRYHKHSASFASLGELHTLQHLDVMNDELRVYNLGIAGTMFECLYNDDDGKTMSCSSLSNWNSGVSFCSLMPKMSEKEDVYTIVRRLAGIPTTARVCKDPEVKHVRYHVGRAITYMLSKYAIASWRIGFDEIGAPTFHFEARKDDKPIPTSCCARPKPAKSQRRMDNNVGKRQYNTWRMLGGATGNTQTPAENGSKTTRPKQRNRGRNGHRNEEREWERGNHHGGISEQVIESQALQLTQFDELRNPMPGYIPVTSEPQHDLNDLSVYPPLFSQRSDQGVEEVTNTFTNINVFNLMTTVDPGLFYKA